MPKAKKKDFHTQCMEHMEKYLPENERVLSGGYELQNPRWMPKKTKNIAGSSKAAKLKRKDKPVTLFGL